jgi:hypothetical protein
MNILTIFSGRKSNLQILTKYLQKALELKILDEVHFWNYTRNLYDETYLKSIANLKRSSSSGGGNYNLLTPVIENNSFELMVKASNDIHIKLVDSDYLGKDFYQEYEIVLGGWDNTKSVVRENSNDLCSLIEENIADGNNYNTFKISINDNVLTISKNDRSLMSLKVVSNFNIKDVFFKTGHGCVGNLKYKSSQNHGFYLMDPCEKNWKSYYSHYADTEFEDDIVLKCDDDIVFIDLYKLPKFIQFIKTTDDYDLIFANTINNGVSAHFQQRKYNLIPYYLMNLEYPENGLNGSLWESGEKAQQLHDYFIENHNKFLNYNYNNEIIPISTRFSINFFGYKCKNWHKISDCWHDDEYNLTHEYSETKNFKNILYSDFYVSHLSFYKQQANGLNGEKLYNLTKKYHDLYDTIEKSGRFINLND